jgi:outer membrane receptor protein involved in Fe transport
MNLFVSLKTAPTSCDVKPSPSIEIGQVSIFAVALALLASTPGHAQTVQTDTVAQEVTDDNEIVVTALKSGEQQLDRVPLAIQAFSEGSLKSRGVRDASDLIQLIPGASQAQEIGAGYRIFSFRGSGAGGPIGDGMIGYYLDDTPFGIPNNQTAPPLQYFDIERVEVLRGPQGTLYGQGSRSQKDHRGRRLRAFQHAGCR